MLIYSLLKKLRMAVSRPTVLLLNNIIFLSERFWLKYFSAAVCACADVR